MKIIFICSSLEPGRDGAGDQTRILAGELIRQGHQVRAISLNEYNLSNIIEDDQATGNINLHVLRIPDSISAQVRYKRVAVWINQFKPDLVSVQYVSFGFQRYGLPLNLIFKFRSAIGNTKLHFMLWELWCGMADNASNKEKFLGVFQKAFLKLMLTTLKPEYISTSTSNYAVDLDRIGIKARLIHVFGNIPLEDYGKDNDWNEILTQTALMPLYNNPSDWLVLGFFGSVYPCPGLEQLLQTAASAAHHMGRKLGVLSIGSGRGQNISSLVQTIEGANYWKTGPLSPSMVNRALRLADMSVVTTNAAGLDKSSTAAAWMERGIPILISSEDYTYDPMHMENQGVFQIAKTADIIKISKLKGHLSDKNFLQDVTGIYSELALVC